MMQVLVEKNNRDYWSAHSTHDVQHPARGRGQLRERVALKEAIVGQPQRRAVYPALANMINMAIRLAVLERELEELRQVVARHAIEEPKYLSEEEDPALAELWDNEYDDVYDRL